MKTLLTISLVTLLGATSLSFAESIDQRQHQQKHRIVQGLGSGELTGREAHRLASQQRQTARTEARFKSDGNFTRRERAIVQHQLNHSSRNIYRKKHNKLSRN